MEILPTQTTAASSSPPAASAASQISSDFETFLVMLTAQMKNQDPLNPLDSQDFATQLATFSGVEQQVQTNDLLRSLQSSLATSQLGEMASWVGMEARMAIPQQFSGEPIEIVPNPPVIADKAELVVWNSAGAEVQRVTIPVSDDPYLWQGRTSNGTPLVDGEYSFGIVSYSNGEVIDESVPETFTEIQEVRILNGETLVAVGDGTLYPADLVRGLRPV